MSRRKPLGAIFFLCALAVASWLALRPRRLAVAGASMAPTIHDGDRVLAIRAAGVRAGMLVVLADPRAHGRQVVKRVVKAGGGRAWVEGDNREASTDSRHFGAVPLTLLRGRVIWRYWPPGRAGLLR